MGSVSVSFKIQNVNQIRRAFIRSPKIMGSELSKAIKKVSFIVERGSKIRTPVDTGRLRSSHTTKFSGTGLSFSGTVATNTNYDKFVHDGTRYMKARPYMQDAVDDSDFIIQDTFKRHTQDALDKIAKRT